MPERPGPSKTMRQKNDADNTRNYWIPTILTGASYGNFSEIIFDCRQTPPDSLAALLIGEMKNGFGAALTIGGGRNPTVLLLAICFAPDLSLSYKF